MTGFFAGRVKRKNKYILAGILALLCLMGGWLIRSTVVSADIFSQEHLRKEAFDRLQYLREKKKTEILELLDDLRQEAFAIKEDDTMRKYFHQVMAGENLSNVEYLIDIRYVERYGDFYDILFIDDLGVVRHSIKKESDYHKNLFRPPFGDSILSRTMKDAHTETFAEFEYFLPSHEPAAFFIVPMEDSGSHDGWLVLQLATNSLNSVLTDRRGMGKTGEVYLVNERKMMLTDSRFSQKSTILRKKIATQAVELGFAEGAGEKVIDDYRGTPVYSSFEQINVFGAHWLLIAEIDEEEVLTSHYRDHGKHLLEKILNHGYQPAKEFSADENTTRISQTFNVRVDMNEFAKSDGRLMTYGVATCTAVAVLYPEEYAYLAHLSPTDEIYMRDWLTRLGLGRQYVNLLEEMFAKIFHYDILPCQKDQLQVVVVVTHQESIGKIITALLDQGLALQNIQLMYNKNGRSANVLVDSQGGSVWVKWREEGGFRIEQSSHDNSLSSDLRSILRSS